MKKQVIKILAGVVILILLAYVLRSLYNSKPRITEVPVDNQTNVVGNTTPNPLPDTGIKNDKPSPVVVKDKEVPVKTLDMKKWLWVKTEFNNGETVTPKKADKFSLAFSKDGRVAISTDCNGMGSEYTLNGNSLSFGPIMATQMYCEGSQESAFSSMLSSISSYFFNSNGELVLNLKYDSGSMIFK